MSNWSNWSGALVATPAQMLFPRSEDDACALVAQITARGGSLRVAGACHSHAPLVLHDDTIVDPQGMAGVISTDAVNHRAWIGAGTRIYALGQALHQAGLALINQGDIDQQAIAGATATGTHGTGVTLRNLSAAVTAARMVLANGEAITCSATEHPELWQASRLHLGAFGLVTAVQMQLRPSYRLQESTWQCDLDSALQSFDAHAATQRHHEFFWYPQRDLAQCKVIGETDADAVYPLGEEGSRCAWSFEVLPNHRPHRHTEMEYSVPADMAADCMRAIRDLLHSRFPDVAWPVEYRSLAADDVWMSTAYARDTITISVHQDVRLDEAPYFRACEEIFLAYQGRPHWGKVNYLSGTQLAACHPRWREWWQVRDQYDPSGTFLNAYLHSIR